MIFVLSMGFVADVAVAGGSLVNALRKTERNLCLAFKSKGCTAKVKKQHAAPLSLKPRKQAAAVEPAAIKKEFVPPEPKAEPAAPPVPVPVPKFKPQQVPVPPEPVVPRAAQRVIPIPKLMPEMPSLPQIVMPPKAALSKQALAPLAAPPVVIQPAQASLCAAELSKYNVEYTVNAKYEQFGFCEIADPVQLSSMMLAGSKVTFPDHPIVGCSYAAQLAKFITEQAGPITVAQTSSTIAKFFTGPGFVCRGRNGDSSAKLSEHAKGDAVDVERIVLVDGMALDVKDAGMSEATHYGVLNAMRHAACGYFSTVLGPGSNEAHKGHFHLDMEVRGKTGTYRICE